MRRYFFTLGLATLLCGTSCVSFSIDPRVVGSYSGANSEALVFLSDRSGFHTRMVNGREERHFLGFYGSHASEPRSLGFAGPDTSPFLGTSFQVSDDFTTVTASWKNRRQPVDSWQVMYYKSAQSR